MSTLFNQHRLSRLFLIIMGGFSILLLVLSLTSPLLFRSKQLPKPSSNPSTKKIPINYSGPTSPIPSHLDVYSVKPTDVPNLLSQIAISLSLSPHPDTSMLWLSPDKKTDLSYDEIGNQIILSFQITTPTPSNLDTTSSIDNANRLIATIAPNYLFTPTKTRFLSGELETVEVSDISTADYIEISYFPTISEHPVFYNQSSLPPLIVLTNKNNQPIKLTYQPTEVFSVYKPKVPTLEISVLVDQVKQGFGEIISLTNPNNPYQNINPTSIATINLTSYQIEYRLFSQLNLIYPYLHFYGTAIDTNNQTLKAEVIIPAIVFN